MQGPRGKLAKSAFAIRQMHAHSDSCHSDCGHSLVSGMIALTACKPRGCARTLTTLLTDSCSSSDYSRLLLLLLRARSLSRPRPKVAVASCELQVALHGSVGSD